MNVTKVNRHERTNIKISDPASITTFRRKMFMFVETVEETVWQSADNREIISPKIRNNKIQLQITCLSLIEKCNLLSHN